jgi:PAS domain S-box-containing protein
VPRQRRRRSNSVPRSILGLLVSFATVAGAPSAVAANRLGRFVRFSVEQGLSQNTVLAILQDRVGFLWFGTEEGLNRFDGYTFAVFRHDPQDPRSLSDDIVSALHEDRQGRLWVGTQHGLSAFDAQTQTFSRVSSIREKVTAIVEDPDGTLWAGTEGEGLFERAPNTSAFVQHRPLPGDPNSLGSFTVAALIRDRRGRLWVGTDSGLDLLEGGRFSHYRNDPRDPRSLVHDVVWGLAEDQAGNLWVATHGGGLSVLDDKTGTFRRYQHRPDDPRSLGTDLVTCLFVDRSGTLWIGTDGAQLQQYDPRSDRFVSLLNDPSDPAFLGRSAVRSLYEDVQGQLWVGTYLAGVSVFRKARAFDFAHSAPEGPSVGAGIASFLEDKEGRIWVGTEQGRLSRFQREAGTFVRYSFPSTIPGGAPVTALHQDRSGRIWVGTYRGGLGRFDPEHGTFVVYTHRPDDPTSLGNDEVWSIAEDETGALWLGTDGGLDRFDPDRGGVTWHYAANYDNPGPQELSEGSVQTLLVDRKGDLWIGTYGGLHVRRRGKSVLVRYRHDDRDAHSLSNDSILALNEDREGRLWVGTSGGLNRFDAATETFTSYRGFPSNVIYGIEDDTSGRLWLSTNRGLSRFNPSTMRIESFDLTNGLQSLQFHQGASLKTRSGRMLFGSADGFYDFDPEAIRPDTYAPRVVLTSLRVLSEPAKLSSALSPLPDVTLTHGDKVFSIEFAALDYTFPRRNQYAYLMAGFSDQWMQLGTRRDVTFTNLDPGTYVFRVKASNSDGVWNDSSTASLRVTVRPPFWRAWWFQGLSATLFVLALFAAHRLRVRRLTTDIAERKRAEAALRRAEEKYRSIFENAMEGIFQSTPDGRLLTANPALARMLGYESREALVEVTDLERQLHLTPDRRRELTRLLETQGEVHGFECEVQRPDGSRIWMSVSARSVRDLSGSLLYYEGTAEDVTEHKRAWAAEAELRMALRRSETMSAMGMLVAGVAHEVRNPLFGISANLDAFEATAGKKRGAFRPMIVRMRGELARLTTLMQELLEYGKPQNSMMVSGPIGTIVIEAVESCAALAAESQVAVVNSIASDLPPVSMDRRRLVQVFQNLLQNAIQHSPVGGTVTVEAARQAGTNGSGVVLTINDCGPGFLSEDMPHVFEPFFSRRQGGTGLGLALAQRIIEEHNGAISVANRDGGGATLVVRLPSGEHA